MTAGPKPSQSLLRAGAAAKAAGVSRQTLNYYLMLGLVEPANRNAAGHGLFDAKAIERIALIKKLNASGYPLREIRDIFLKDRPTNASEDSP